MKYSKAWLDYRRMKITDMSEYHKLSSLCSVLIVNKRGRVIDTAISEYAIAIDQILGLDIMIVPKREDETIDHAVVFDLVENDESLVNDGYKLLFKDGCLYLTSLTGIGLLYAVFELGRQLQTGADLFRLDITVNPAMNLRIINHWDNMDGSIERGYSGNSFFFKNNRMIHNDRIRMYTRLMASIGINAIVINNVNVHEHESYLITDKYLSSVRKYAELFSDYGIKLYLCVNFASSIELGHLSTADPLDRDVISWWEDTVKYVFDEVPDLGGFVVKADSEGRPGPFTYGRTQADGANMLGRVLKPYGGLLIWRCFVYNCGQDWRDYDTDRAKAAYDYFVELDGSFDDNVVLQIKNGPMDFQIREPVSPLFGGLKKTNTILEVQIAQEYTGQQKDICYLVPMWKEVLRFDTYVQKENSTIQDIVSGRT
ncbi:MAG: alpha-glucuronidase, partial [Lachnoclostridium sp.]|nr:alpha-glucuronidase [Lachnoclostridium sp.]